MQSVSFIAFVGFDIFDLLTIEIIKVDTVCRTKSLVNIKAQTLGNFSLEAQQARLTLSECGLDNTSERVSPSTSVFFDLLD